MKVKLRTVGGVILAGVVVAGIVVGLVVYLGTYNVSALTQHTKPVFKVLEYALGRSVTARAESIAAPDLSDRQRVERGAAHYRVHCLQCHGAPGVSPHSLAFGMTPAPANLVATAREWPAKEIYWIIKHGIKMSGMPAWEYRMRDEEMWDIVAFVATLPTLSPADYAKQYGQMPVPQSHASASRHAPAREEALRPGTAVSPPPVPATVPARSASLGDVDAGRRAASNYLCATCHVIPGIVGATQHVGPPLNGIAKRKYIAGILANNPDNMVAWLMHPQQFAQHSAMPDLGVTEKDAREMAAFLYTLEDLD